jgi:hypothetical protein
MMTIPAEKIVHVDAKLPLLLPFRDYKLTPELRAYLESQGLTQYSLDIERGFVLLAVPVHLKELYESLERGKTR